jgi:hypothetical protein
MNNKSPHTLRVYKRAEHPIGFYNLKKLIRSTRFTEAKLGLEKRFLKKAC